METRNWQQDFYCCSSPEYPGHPRNTVLQQKLLQSFYKKYPFDTERDKRFDFVQVIPTTLVLAWKKRQLLSRQDPRIEIYEILNYNSFHV